MAEITDRSSNELAERLRRWIIAAGYVLGGWAILQTALMIGNRGLPFNRFFPIHILMPIHRLTAALWLVSPLLLVVGCWGFQHHRRWARPVLLTYAGMWIAGVFGLQTLEFIDMLSGAYDDFPFLQHFDIALGGFDLAIYASVYPILLILCLCRPEVRDQFPEFRPGFAPILHDKSS